MSGLLTAALTWVGKWLGDMVARLVSDWRRDRDLEAMGAAKADAYANAASAEAERRAASVPAMGEEECITELEKGDF